MSDTTLEEARRCPECQEMGRSAGTRMAEAGNRRAGLLHIFRCENTRCKKHNRDWIVQIRADGTIPEPSLNREKSFYIDKANARTKINKAREGFDRLVEQTLEK